MKQYYTQINNLKLFSGISQDELQLILQCQKAYIRCFQKKETILMAGDALHEMRIIIVGTVEMYQECFNTSHHLYAYLEAGEFFGEYAVRDKSRGSVFSYQAITDCVILYLDWEKITHICPQSCRFHKTIVCNILDIFMERNIMLVEKLEVMSYKSIREKLLAYFYQQTVIQNSHQIVLPFTRTELANYLGVNRSAMTRELAAMTKTGCIDYKNGKYFIHFNQPL